METNPVFNRIVNAPKLIGLGALLTIAWFPILTFTMQFCRISMLSEIGRILFLICLVVGPILSIIGTRRIQKFEDARNDAFNMVYIGAAIQLVALLIIAYLIFSNEYKNVQALCYNSDGLSFTYILLTLLAAAGTIIFGKGYSYLNKSDLIPGFGSRLLYIACMTATIAMVAFLIFDWLLAQTSYDEYSYIMSSAYEQYHNKVTLYTILYNFSNFLIIISAGMAFASGLVMRSDIKEAITDEEELDENEEPVEDNDPEAAETEIAVENDDLEEAAPEDHNTEATKATGNTSKP